MVEIKDIYQGYHSLFEYLEEKFIGGVYAVNNVYQELILVTPVTQITLDAFVKPACKKFNALGSTQLVSGKTLNMDYNGVTICTERLEALIYVLHYVAHRGIPLQYVIYKHPLGTGLHIPPNGPTLPPGRTQIQLKGRLQRPPTEPPPPYGELNTLKAWLEILTADTIAGANLYTLGSALKHYEKNYGPSQESKDLHIWLDKHAGRTHPIIKEERSIDV